MPELIVKFIKLSENAKIPSKGSADASGYDIYSAENKWIESKNRALIKTDLKIEIGKGYGAQIRGRSGLACKHHIDVKAGTIDNDYRGEIKILLHNTGERGYEIKKGDRIAQMIFERNIEVEFEEVALLTSTERGIKGFGSTGKN